jgi:hypothetical protein
MLLIEFSTKSEVVIVSDHFNLNQEKHCEYNVTFKRIRITIVIVEKLLLLYILSVCL